MITGLFVLQLLITFLAGSVWIFAATWSGIRFGTRTGGFIGGLPSTSLISFFFIGLTQSPEKASEATTVFPLAFAATGIFLVIYASLAKKGLTLALSAGLSAWLILSSLIIFFNPRNFAIIIIIYIIILVFNYYMLEKKLGIRSVSGGKTDYSTHQTAYRSVAGGLVMALAVLLAKIGGPVYGGIFAAFPAMFVSTIVITYKIGGAEMSAAITKPLMASGMVTIIVYAAAVKYLYISCGLYAGTIISIMISAVSAWFTLLFIRRGMS